MVRYFQTGFFFYSAIDFCIDRLIQIDDTAAHIAAKMVMTAKITFIPADISGGIQF
jgi:hypothetical protein